MHTYHVHKFAFEGRFVVWSSRLKVISFAHEIKVDLLSDVHREFAHVTIVMIVLCNEPEQREKKTVSIKQLYLKLHAAITDPQ